ncbi:MAG: MEDS domain-containing protein [Steroidobacteraceae bacterium]
MPRTLLVDSSSTATAQDSSVLAADHFVQFFDADGQLVDAVSRFVDVGIRSGDVCVVIATPEHRKRLAFNLSARGLNVAKLESAYQYIAVDAAALLGQFFCDGLLNRCRFHDRVGLLLRQASSSGKPVRIFGEMVALVADGQSAGVMLELEELWNELGRFHDFVLFCGYPSSSFDETHTNGSVDRVCALHSHALMARSN